MLSIDDYYTDFYQSAHPVFDDMKASLETKDKPQEAPAETRAPAELSTPTPTMPEQPTPQPVGQMPVAAQGAAAVVPPEMMKLLCNWIAIFVFVMVIFFITDLANKINYIYYNIQMSSR